MNEIEDTATENISTEDVLTEDTATEDVLTENTATEDVLTENTATEDTVTEDTVPEDTVPEDTVPEDAVTEDTVTEDTPTENISDEATDTKEDVANEADIKEEVIEEEVAEEATKEEAAETIATPETPETTEEKETAEIMPEVLNPIEGDLDLAEPQEPTAKSDELVYELPEEAEEAVAKGDSPYDRPGKWYVVSITSGQEKLAKSNLETRIQTMNVAGKIFEVVIPMEEQVEFKGTKKEVVQKKVFPGYILVRCHLNDETWHVIRNTPSITGFIGAGTKPIPLRRSEVESFLGDKSDGQNVQKKIRPRLRYEVGETVRVKEGPFTDFQGEVTEINEDQLKVKLLLNIFGRETPVELEFSQVSKQ